MDRLAGLRYRDIAARLRRHGFRFERNAKGSHELWGNPATGRRTVIPNHPGDLPEGTVRGILQLADLSIDAFLAD